MFDLCMSSSTATPPSRSWTAYRFPDDLVAAALSSGYEALALTDHNSLSGSMEFAVSARALGLRPIHGAEIDLDDGRHLTLLVENARGWSSLCRLLTRAHAHTRDAARAPLAGAGAARRRALRTPRVSSVSAAAPCAACTTSRRCARLREAFGPDRLRVELQRPFLRDDRARNRRLAALARTAGRAVRRDRERARACPRRAPLQDAFVAIRLHSTLDASEPQRRGNFSHVLASPAAMAARFPEHPEAVAETERLAEPPAVRPLQRPRIPLSRAPRTAEAMAELAELCSARLHDRYAHASRAACARSRPGRLQEELRIIEKLQLAGFFLLHHDMLELAREVAAEVRGAGGAGSPRSLLPPGRGRGSSVSSIVCYLTGLSHVDPIANELMIGRFLNEELTSLPDIDLDFPRDIRAALIPRVHERYGRDRSALVAAFPDLSRARRDQGARQGAGPAARGDRAAGAGQRGMGLAQRRPATSRARSGSRGAMAGRWRWLAQLAAQAHGLPRHLSQHSGGMIVATRPLIDCCPIVPAAMEGRQIVQWDKDSCSDAGFLKIDLLGLGMLSAVERCVEMIARTRVRAHRPEPDPVRRPGRPTSASRAPTRPGSSRSRAARRCSRCAAPGRRTSRTSRSRWRSSGRGRSREARSTPTSNAASACGSIPDYRDPVRASVAESPSCARRSGRSSSRIRCSRSRSRSPASRRARRRACDGR